MWTTLKTGNVITASGYRFTDGQPILRVQKNRDDQRQRDASVW
jgi:hypothetical protein